MIVLTKLNYLIKQNYKSLYLILIVALMGAERVNLMPSLGYILQPYYVLILPVIVLTIFRLPRPFIIYLAALAILLASSAICNPQITLLHWKRVLLFYFIHVGALCLATFFKSQNKHEELLIKSLMAYIVLNIVFSIAEAVSFIENIYQYEEFKNINVVNLNAFTISFETFRPTGISLDPNRGTFNYLFAIMAIVALSKISYRHIILYAFSILSLSKTAVIATILPFLYEIKSDWRRLLFFFASLAIIFGIIFHKNYLPISSEPVANSRISSTLIDERLSVEPGSSGHLHMQLIGYGWERFVGSNLIQKIVGSGFSYASFDLKDLFYSKYANYHSQFITILVEQGILGLVLYMLAIFWLWCGISDRERWLLILPFLSFQIFYQNMGEPIVIFILGYFYIRHVVDTRKN